MNRYLIILIMILYLLPASAYAHVKWFTETDAEQASIDQIITPAFAFFALLSAVIISFLPFALKKLRTHKPSVKLESRVASLRAYTFVILQYGTAVSLVIQIFRGNLFAPELMALEGIWLWLTVITVILLLIPMRITVRSAGVILLFLYGVTIYVHSWLHMLDYVFYLGIIFIFFFYRTKLNLWTFPFLYLTTGFSLCWVAVEKWVYPNMSANVLINHDIFTFGFEPGTFAMMLGFVEFVVGYLLIIGLLNRLLALVLTGIFFSTALLFGWLELIGHFPIHVILLTFIIEGVSFYKPPVSFHERTWQQITFISVNFILVLSFMVLMYYRLA
ncbi:DoxX family membrane protein [Alkalicoccus daliensis]|uniref:DoxX protein n=1 Tax=Alkalicoccus daliensis TaxID=745820 RepID=A0A1H0E093_9BACI|nr:DoxX family membrane protein [Alkalicoccus daliensis]SDN75661.1 DoxX protein [Alkalicoccus daliensis]